MAHDPAAEVVLFPGDPDSTAWAAERARGGAGPLLLLAPTGPAAADAPLEKRRRELFAAIESIAVRPVTLGHGPLAGPYAAPAHSLRALALPPGMEPARPGGTNPYLLATQGEVFRRALAAGLPAPVLTRTVGCARAPCPAQAHCGHCPACLVRRAGLLTALGRDNTPYLVDIWNVADHADTLRDVRAVRDWLRRDLHPAELRLPRTSRPGDDAERLRETLDRARAELRRMFDTGGDRRSVSSAA